jgi:hypothetical protein
MQQERIIDFIRAQPFQPFDIRTSDGKVYSVDHPEFLARSRDGRTVTFYAPEDGRIVIIDLGQVVATSSDNRPPA